MRAKPPPAAQNIRDPSKCSMPTASPGCASEDPEVPTRAGTRDGLELCPSNWLSGVSPQEAHPFRRIMEAAHHGQHR